LKQLILLCAAIACAACTADVQPRRGPTTEGRGVATLAAGDSAVRAYLALARDGRYAAAMSSYDGEWRPLAAAWFQAGDTLGAPEFLAQACQGLLFCHLGVRRTVALRWSGPDTLAATYELSNRDGSRFAPPACCGEAGGPDTLFTFRAVRTARGFRMLDLPVYRP